jgi:HEAT repeat protein
MPDQPNRDDHQATNDTLPPIEAPSAGFLLQLFVIPMVIVTIIVLVWMMFSWLAHMGSNPQQLVMDLKRLNEASWQKALTLADLLRNSEYEYLKRDPEIASELGSILEGQLEADEGSDESIKLRMFLSRALGEFHVDDVLPILLMAAEHESRIEDIDVRRTAVEAIAVYANNNGAESLRSNERVLKVLQATSRERSDQPTDKAQRDELRSTAAFALGVIGGDDALDRLELLMSDGHANTRYNAALGLARHGDSRAGVVLLEMLDPQNEVAAEGEQYQSGKESKRMLVIKNGIRGAGELTKRGDTTSLTKLETALQTIIDSDLLLLHPRVRRGIRMEAEETLIAVRSK